MHTQETEQQSLQISERQLVALVQAFIGGTSGREDDEHPLPPGPWDPVVRLALERTAVFGPQPEPWRLALATILARHPEVWDAIGGGRFGERVGLNPQPLPPRWAFFVSMAQAVTNRAELLHEIADATASDSERQGIIIVGGYLSRFADDVCGNGFRLRFPFPGPRPHWLPTELGGIDLMVMAAQFQQAAAESFSSSLQAHLTDASAKLARAGVSRMR